MVLLCLVQQNRSADAFGHGSITGLAEMNGSELEKFYEYDAFGAEITKEESDTNPFRYCGEYYDSEIDKIYLRARYYSPLQGRFMTEDPIRDGLNWYAYCGGNPVGFVDPMGLAGTFYYNIYNDINEVKEGINNILEAKEQYEYIELNYFEDDSENLKQSWSDKANREREKILNSKLMNSCYELKSIFKNIFDKEYGATYQETSALLCVMDDYQMQVVDYAAANTPKAFWNGIPEGSSISINQRSLENSYVNNVCFIENTLIISQDGYIPIQDINVGDYVYSMNENTFETDWKKVKHIFVNETMKLVEILVGDNKIVCTEEHPFWVIGKGWISAASLTENDLLLNYNGDRCNISKIEKVLLEKPVKVYNFEVEDWHTYFVSNGIWVHNTCMNNKQAISAAENLGYVRVKGAKSHGQLVFTNGKNYITVDADSHSGGA